MRDAFLVPAPLIELHLYLEQRTGARAWFSPVAGFPSAYWPRTPVTSAEFGTMAHTISIEA